MVLVVGGYGILRGRRVPSSGTQLALRQRDGTRPLTVVQSGRLGWTLHSTSPLEGMPEVGAQVQLQSAGVRGLAVYQATVTAIDEARNHIYVTPPQRCLQIDRRDAPRLRPSEAWASLEEQPVRILDISCCGMRLSAKEPCEEGERVRLDFPHMDDPVYAWVLDCEFDESDAGAKVAWQIRVRFEDLVGLSAFKRPPVKLMLA